MENNVEVDKKRKLSCRADDQDSECSKPRTEGIEFGCFCDKNNGDVVIVDSKKRKLSCEAEQRVSNCKKRITKGIEFRRVDDETGDGEAVDNKKRKLSCEADPVVSDCKKTKKVGVDDKSVDDDKKRKLSCEADPGVSNCKKLKTKGVECGGIYDVVDDSGGDDDEIVDTKKQQNWQGIHGKKYELTHPFFSWMFKGWNPLEEPSHGSKLVKLWRQAFPETDTMLSDIVIRAISTSQALDRWDFQDSERMFKFLDSWEHLLPEQYIDNTILDGTVLKGLRDALGRWDPLDTKSQFIYHLILWDIQYMGRKFKAKLCHLAREQLWSRFGQWKQGQWRHVTSAVVELGKVMDSESWEWLVENIVVPQLKMELKGYCVASNRVPLSYVYDWLPHIRIPVMVDLMENHIFPRWFEQLDHELEMGGKEVSELFECSIPVFRLKCQELNLSIRTQFSLACHQREESSRLDSRREFQRLIIEELKVS